MIPAPIKILVFVLGAFLVRAAERPNVVFIMTDDHASHAISAYGSKVNQTPNLDRLATEGAIFERCFVTNSICTPSRATLMTGKYSHRNGTPVFNRFDGSQPTVAKLMQAAGYYTALIGKWHLGSDPTGFDHWEIFPGQGVYENPTLYTATGETTYTGRYATHVVTELTIDVLKRRPKDKPFLLFCHHKAPHREWTPEPKYREAFAKRTIPEPATLWDDYASRSEALHENRQTVAHDLTNRDLKRPPPSDLGTGSAARSAWLNEKPERVEVEVNGQARTLVGDDLIRWKYQRYMQDYLACVQSVDDSVGQILDSLRSEGLDRNTIVIYTSDNGFYLGDHGLYDKRYMYEESLRIPFLVRWPAGLKSGTRIGQMVINTDFAPTMLDAAGVAVPADMQGRSLLPLLRGETPGDWRTSFYYRYYHDPGDHRTARHLGVRTATHKLIHFWKKDQWELFDLVADPHELRNVYGQPGQEGITVELKDLIGRHQRELQDDGQYAEEQPPAGVDGPVAKLRGK